MHNPRRKPVIVLLLLCVVAAGVGIWLTGSAPQAGSRRRGFTASSLVDQRPLQVAQQLERLADTREDGRMAADALNLADHEVDLAFTTAMREAQDHPPKDTPETRQLREKINQLKQLVAASDAEVQNLQARQKTAKDPTSVAPQLQLAQSEQALHQDELQDAKLDLARAGGDPAARIQWLYNQHEAVQHQEQSKTPYWTRPQFSVPGTMAGQLRQWFALASRRSQINDAQQQATSLATDLSARHQKLEQQTDANAASSSSSTADANQPRPAPSDADRLKQLKRASNDRKTLGEFNQRVADLQQLAQAYDDWAALESSEIAAAMHGFLKGLLTIFIILIGVVLASAGVERLATRLQADRRRVATMRLLGRFVVQAIGLLLILIVIVGPPSQLSTLLALAGAGLTVALKDFIVAFFGWFVLMGRNGIRVGDWVEINGILGEVVEIGLLRTVLLETGNWNEAGHPTGRRVTLVNSFAIEGHYFNFSTSGQWLWDALEFTVPAGSDPYPIRDAVLELVRKETESTAQQAEREWQSSAQSHSGRPISGEAMVDVRPSPIAGTNIIVRYITSAHERFALRAKLYHEVVELLRGTASMPAGQTR